jgi:multiple sugar transport system permease protein
MAAVSEVQSTTQARGGVGQPRLNETTREAITGWLFALPWIIGLVLFTLGPMLFSLYTSFTQYRITTDPVWIGTRNYENLFQDPRFYQSLGNTFWMVIVKTPVVIIVSLILALLLNVDVPLGRFFRTIFYLPNVLAGVAAILLWKWILQPSGLLNDFLGLIGIKGPAWLIDPNWTKPALVVMGTWWIGGMILIFLAGLKGIPSNLYEAGALDGAVGWRKTWYITIPMLSPTIFFQIVTTIIGTFQIFTTAFILTSGTGQDASLGGPGPGSLLFYVLYLYNRAFGITGAGGFQMGYASAMAWILLFIVLAITGVQLLLAQRWVHYETER